MIEIKKAFLIEVLRLLPKYGLSLERFANENPYIITGVSLRNYVSGKTIPTNKKYHLIMQRLENGYSLEYSRAKEKILSDHKAKSLNDYLESCYHKRYGIA